MARTLRSRFVKRFTAPEPQLNLHRQQTYPQMRRCKSDAGPLDVEPMALLDYLAARREELEAQMKALRAELAEIRIAEDALTGGKPKEQLYGTVHPGGGRMLVRSGSIKDWIIRALTAYPDGNDTDAVIEAVRKMGGPIVLRSSMTPQLSRLKAAGLIEHVGRNWRIPRQSEAQKNETPDGYQPSDASEEEDDELADLR